MIWISLLLASMMVVQVICLFGIRKASRGVGEATTRHKILLELRAYIESHDKVSMADVIKIVKGDK